MTRPRSKASEAYLAKLRDPRWQKMRLQILERDEWACRYCGDTESTLHVHHQFYTHGKEPWDYPEDSLICLCESCHREESEQRDQCEKNLLLALKRCGFNYSDVQNLAIGFSSMRLRHLPEVVASAFEFALENPEIQDLILDRYFADLKRRYKGKPTWVDLIEPKEEPNV